MKLSLNEIRIMQSFSVKKKIPFSSVSAKDKKVFKQLHLRGLIARDESHWHLAKSQMTE